MRGLTFFLLSERATLVHSHHGNFVPAENRELNPSKIIGFDQ